MVFQRVALALLVSAFVLVLVPGPRGAQAIQPGLSPGLRVTATQDGQSLEVVSAGRFALRLDAAGISAWYDLRRDPDRRRNLVQAGTTLVTHPGVDGEALRAPWHLELANPVLARVSWRGVGFSRSYEIWAAGQVVIVTTGAGGPMALRRSPEAITGAALDSTGDGAATLFLDAWTGEDAAPGPAAAGAFAALVDQRSSAPPTITLPETAGLRAPRLVVEGWASPAHTLLKGDTVLVEGQDYLAHWDQANSRLYAQVLTMVPPGGGEAARSFTVLDEITPALSLGVLGRTLTPDGMLQVDGNMPDNDGERSTYDTFSIPYIQSSPAITLTGAFQGPGAGVEFVLNGESRTVFGQPGAVLEAAFTLPALGTYSAEGYRIDASGARLSPTPDDVIAPLAVGRVVVTIGDSITSGSNGDAVRPGDLNFPVTSYLNSPGASADRRNIFQYDNRNRYGEVRADFQRGYQVGLNDLLTACGGAPIFLLNDGYGGLRLSYKRSQYTEPPNNSALAKVPAYLDHVDRLGAQYLLIQIGTNDVFDGQSRTTFRADLLSLVDQLRGTSTGRHIWLARLPYSEFRTITDPTTLADRQKRLTDFNREITKVVESLNTAGRPVRLGPDFYTYFKANPLQLDDGTHPTQAGYEVMARLWAGQSVGGLLPIVGLPCEVFSSLGLLPPRPVELVRRIWTPYMLTDTGE